MRKPRSILNKRGLNSFVSYALYAGIVFIISTLAFLMLRTYIPEDIPSCNEGTKILIEAATCTSNEIEFSVSNIGRFSVESMFVRIGKERAGPEDSSFRETLEIIDFDPPIKPERVENFGPFEVDSPGSYIIEVQAGLSNNGDPVPCPGVISTQKVTCS